MANIDRKTLQELHQRIADIHRDACILCREAVGSVLANSGNIGIFCRDEQEYTKFTELRLALTEPSDNPSQKYFRLYRPIGILARDGQPATKYRYLYIRMPDYSDYGRHAGDVDFYVEEPEFRRLYESLTGRIDRKNISPYKYGGYDMIEIQGTPTGGIAYISTEAATKRVHTRE